MYIYFIVIYRIRAYEGVTPIMFILVKFQNTETIKYRSDVEQDEMQNDTATLTISYKTEHIRTK